MSEDLETASQFLEALANAAETGEREQIFRFLAADIEWANDKRTLRGIDEIRSDLTWLGPPDNLDVEFEQEEPRDLGDGHIVVDVHETYRLRASREFAYARDLRVELSVRDGTVARYEMRVVG